MLVILFALSLKAKEYKNTKISVPISSLSDDCMISTLSQPIISDSLIIALDLGAQLQIRNEYKRQITKSNCSLSGKKLKERNYLPNQMSTFRPPTSWELCTLHHKHLVPWLKLCIGHEGQPASFKVGLLGNVNKIVIPFKCFVDFIITLCIKSRFGSTSKSLHHWKRIRIQFSCKIWKSQIHK